jgi:hypothetical protein
VKRCRSAILVAALVAALALPAIAGELSFGAKAGLSTTNVTGLPEEWRDVKSYRAGFAAGIFLNVAIDDAFSLQPELLYLQKGFTGNLYDGFIDVDVTPELDYIELPLLAKFTFSGGSKIRPCIFAGPSLAIATSSELRISAGWLATSIDISSLTNDTDFGIVAGAGFSYDIGRGRLTFDARYQRGFSNLVESGEFDIAGETQTISIDEFKNYGFAFMAGYQF